MLVSRAAAVVILLCSLGCGKQELTVEERGARVFVRNCSGCHGVDGRAAGRTSLRVAPRNLTDPAMKALGDADVVRTIREGKGQMPPFGKLMPEEDLKAVVRYVRTLHRGAGAAAPSASTTGQSASATRAP